MEKIPLIKNIFKKSNKTNFENYFSLEEIYVDFKNIFSNETNMILQLKLYS